jgi:hypothetical protein
VTSSCDDIAASSISLPGETPSAAPSLSLPVRVGEVQGIGHCLSFSDWLFAAGSQVLQTYCADYGAGAKPIGFSNFRKLRTNSSSSSSCESGP